MEKGGRMSLGGESREERIERIYGRLKGYYGAMHWWPGDSAFEIMVGAILTQNTNWRNVERALENVKRENCLEPAALWKCSDSDIERMIRPSGFYRVKTRRLRAFLGMLMREYDGDVQRLCDTETYILRERLLAVSGIGEETADSMLLYGAGKTIFVIDNYTRRILKRHGIIKDDWSYGDIQTLCMGTGEQTAEKYRDFHGYIVMTGKEFCRKVPRCGGCPLEKIP